MGIIIINDGGFETFSSDSENVRLIRCRNHTCIEADIIVQVRNWLFHIIYDGGYTDKNKHWQNRRALANAVMEYAIRTQRPFWSHVQLSRSASIGLDEIVTQIPLHSYQMIEEAVLRSMDPP